MALEVEQDLEQKVEIDTVIKSNGFMFHRS
jgi:hypothetical protein